MTSSIRSWTLPALAALLGAVVALSACRTQPLLTPEPIRSEIGTEQNRAAILRGMAAHRWKLVSEKPGRITARQDKQGKHAAEVDISYDSSKIAIQYRDSTNLRCEPSGNSCESIHRAYNRWVVNLAQDIEYASNTIRNESVGAGPPSQP